MIKMVVSDIDGTLSKEGTKKIKQAYITIIKKLVKKGIMVVVASGRNETEINGLFKSIRDKVFYVSNNGGLISKCDELYFKNPISKFDSKLLLDYLLSNDDFKFRPIIISTIDGKTYALNKDDSMISFLTNHYNADAHVVESFTKYYGSIIKINVYCEDDTNNIRSKLNKVWGDKYSIVVSGKHWIDVCEKNASKGNAVAFIKKKYDIKDNEMVVLGDNFNDISMLKLTKYSFVPNTSNPVVKKFARYVIPSYEYDGPLKVFKAILDFG